MGSDVRSSDGEPEDDRLREHGEVRFDSLVDASRAFPTFGKNHGETARNEADSSAERSRTEPRSPPSVSGLGEEKCELRARETVFLLPVRAKSGRGSEDAERRKKTVRETSTTDRSSAAENCFVLFARTA